MNRKEDKRMVIYSFRIFSLLAFALLLTSSGYGQEATSQPAASSQVMTNGDVERMVEAKLANDTIISKIKTSTCNFDTSIDAMLKLKAAGVSDAVIQAMVEAGAAAKAGAKEAPPKESPAPDPNDPKSPHDGGIYWLPKERRDKAMVQMEPSVYSAGKSTGMFKMAMTYGMSKAKWKAAVRDPRAKLRISESVPEFWFYFEEKSHGLSNSGFSSGASSPNEFILARMEQKGKERELVVGELGAFGASTGTRSKDVVELTFVKVASGTYRVTPNQAITPGEYCFFYAGTNMAMGATGGKLFDFGIDRAQ